MKLAFTLFKYFPYGGVQRDCLKIARECVRRGHRVELYTLAWEGPRPDDMVVHVIPVPGMLNHRRYERFAVQVAAAARREACDVVVGFNRMPGLDLYFAADPCFARKCRERSVWYGRLPRSRSFLRAEAAVYGPESDTRILLLTDRERDDIRAIYGTPEERFRLLPPGVAPAYLAPPDHAARRLAFRRELGLKENDRLVLMVGSGFRTKGLDRALHAFSSLPPERHRQTVLAILGRDHRRPFLRLAKRLGVANRVRFMGGRDDAEQFMFAADVLIHPAYREAAGMVLLEALAAGLPVLASGACGYADRLRQANCGIVLDEPFRQEELDTALARMLTGDEAEHWRNNGRQYIETHDIFGLAAAAADIIEETAS
ncbi:MAG: glycosyltransferase family 4 protein [Deltaproteobacteria bacterium]|nr:glycosyltransferase family 4 protein [Candidatus Anaeroferrophillacea bacterium]